jgi:hypothetical protein
LKRGVFRSVVDLQAAINRFVAETNADPKPFICTADPDKIIAAVKRGHQVLIPSTRSTAASSCVRVDVIEVHRHARSHVHGSTVPDFMARPTDFDHPPPRWRQRNPQIVPTVSRALCEGTATGACTLAYDLPLPISSI